MVSMIYDGKSYAEFGVVIVVKTSEVNPSIAANVKCPGGAKIVAAFEYHPCLTNQ